jgi:hypothetical protein
MTIQSSGRNGNIKIEIIRKAFVFWIKNCNFASQKGFISLFTAWEKGPDAISGTITRH